jgi:hypothetical protein
MQIFPFLRSIFGRHVRSVRADPRGGAIVQHVDELTDANKKIDGFCGVDGPSVLAGP